MLLLSCSPKKTPTPDALYEPKQGDIIATITVKDYGEINAVLFPDRAPKAVENFITLANSGYYDNLSIHKILLDSYICSGNPTTSYLGGQSIYEENGGLFANEITPESKHFSGALSMMNWSYNSNGSQFFIVNTPPIDIELLNTFTSQSTVLPYTEEDIKNYSQHGGLPHFDGLYTVFGYVFEGIEVVDKIMSHPDLTLTTTYFSPLPIVESVKISTY